MKGIILAVKRAEFIGGVTTTTELIPDDILSKKCHMNLCPILNIYRVTFVFGFLLNFSFNINYKLHHLNAFIVTKTNLCGLDCL
jgi:hypothetical protein